MQIQGMKFSGFPGHDSDNLRRLDYAGRVEWFRYRFNLVFLTPFRRLIALEGPDCYVGCVSWNWLALPFTHWRILRSGMEATTQSSRASLTPTCLRLRVRISSRMTLVGVAPTKSRGRPQITFISSFEVAWPTPSALIGGAFSIGKRFPA